MFGIVHVLLPVSERPPAEAIRASLARFQRGGRGDLPDERLTFCDEIEPDLAAFADRYVENLERHPVTGGYGRWLNPLGRWDWWDLGGTLRRADHGRAPSPCPDRQRGLVRAEPGS